MKEGSVRPPREGGKHFTWPCRCFLASWPGAPIIFLAVAPPRECIAQHPGAPLSLGWPVFAARLYNLSLVSYSRARRPPSEQSREESRRHSAAALP